MENRNKQGTGSEQEEPLKSEKVSPWADWTRQHRVPQDSRLVSFGDKVTYTFVIGNDVASIHYDMARGEIFYKGHKVTKGDMETWVVNIFNHFKTVLAKSRYADKFLESYRQLIEKMQSS